MIEIRRILCPVDFSEISHRALEYAVALAERQGSSLLALHVLPFTPPMIPLPLASTPVYPVPEAYPRQAIRRSMLEQLEEAVEPARRAGLSVETIVREGDAAGMVRREAVQLPIDLIVVGSDRAGGFERLVTGSVAEAILRTAPCPVLTVGPRWARASAGDRAVRCERILCAVDFSGASILGLEYGLSLCEGPSTRLTLLSVHDDVRHTLLPVKPEPEDADDVRALHGMIEKHLRMLLPADVESRCTPRTLVRRGKPYEQILQVTEEEGPDVVVVGAHGKSLLERLLLGSVTNQVVRRAACPVLTVRATARAARAVRSRRHAVSAAVS